MRTATYTVYNEAGGMGKTTLTANLEAAHARAGQRVILIDLDPQNGDLSYLLGVDDDRGDPSADSLAGHLGGQPLGPFEDLVREAEPGLDVVPAHNRLEDIAVEIGRLRSVLVEADVMSQYDVVAVDPPAMPGPHVYNAIDAARSLVIPTEQSDKGGQSVGGLEEIADGPERNLGIGVGVLAVVPNGIKGTDEQKEKYLEKLREELDYPVPVLIGERESLVRRCWGHQCTFFTYGKEHGRLRKYERETLHKIGELASMLTDQFRGS